MTMITNDDVAARWRTLNYLEDTWTVVRSHARIGHQGGVFAESASLGRKVYIKPKDPKLSHRSAANEKLAADFAHDLGVNVPPAVLTHPPTSGWDGQDLVCASLVMFGFQLHWGAAKHGVRNPVTNSDTPKDSVRGAIMSDTPWGIALRKIAPIAASRALVFDSWVGQVDHDHPSNIAWGINPEDETDNDLLFFDYEMAFGIGGWSPVVKAPFPAELLALLDVAEVFRTIDQVERYEQGRLRDTVQRIPDRYLTGTDKAEIIQQLLERRTMVRAAFTV